MDMVAIYARVSDRERQGDNFSIPTQLGLMREACGKEGWEVAYQLSEKDSAFMEGLHRAELNKVRELARDGKITILLFFSPDRFTRDIGDGVILRRELRKYGVRLFCFTPQLHEISDDLEIMHILTDWQSQQYVEKLREASMRGTKGKVESGLFPQGMAPYGYRIVGKKRDTRLEVDNEEANVIRDIFEWYAFNDIGSHEIAATLNSRSIPSNAYGRNNQWTPAKVRRVLGNEAYTGVWYAYTWKAVGKKERIRLPKDEQYKIAIPEIIQRLVWEAVQEKLRSRQTGKGGVNYALMSCRTRCTCGTSMAAVRMRDRHRLYGYEYYRCVSYRLKNGDCGAKQWKCPEVDETVWQFAYELLYNPEKLLLGYRKLQEKEQEAREIYTIQIETLTAQIAEQERVLSEMMEQRKATKSRSVTLMLDSQIEECGQALDALIARKESLEKLQHAQTLTDEDIKRLTDEVEKVREMMEALKTINEEADLSAKRALIELLNLRCTLRTDEKGDRWVDIHWLTAIEPRKLYDQKTTSASRSCCP